MSIRGALRVGVLLAAAGVARAAGPPGDVDAGRKEFLRLVAQSDRGLEAGRSALSHAVSTARVFYRRLARRLDRDKRSARAHDKEALADLSKAAAALLLGLSRSQAHLAATVQSLDQAAKLRTDLDRAIAGRRKQQAREMAKAAEALGAQRKRVQRLWDHYQTPRLANSPTALKDAKVLVEVQMSVSAGLWSAWDLARSRHRFLDERRRRFRRAGLAVERRLAEVRAIRGRLATFQAGLLNPLDHASPGKALEKLAWPEPLRTRVTGLDQSFKRPRPYRVPSQWSLRDRVLRFVKGGSP